MIRALTHILALFLVTFSAAAAQAKTRVTIHEFFGPHSGALRAETEQILRNHRDALQIVSKDEVEAAARSLGVDVLSPAGRKAMSRELGLSAWVTGIVRKHGDGLRLTIVVYDGAEHESMGRAVLEGRSAKVLHGAVKRELWLKAKDAILLALAPLPPGRGPIDEVTDAPSQVLPEASTPPVAATAPPAQAEPNHDPKHSAPALEASSSVSAPESTSASAAPEPSAPPSSVMFRRDDPSLLGRGKRERAEALRVSLSIGSPYRKLVYSDPLTSSLGDYELAGMPMLDLSVIYYPARSFTQGWASWLGLDLLGQFALGGGANTDREGNRFRARYDAYRVGVRVRVPVSKHFVSAFSGYTINRISFASDTKGLSAPTPDVDYRMVRTGAGTELQLTNALALAIDGAWLHVLSVGELGVWFPHASAGAFELGMNASYVLGHRMFARLSATYQRIAFDFHSKPGDTKVAGGATDQLLTASLGIGVGI